MVIDLNLARPWTGMESHPILGIIFTQEDKEIKISTWYAWKTDQIQDIWKKLRPIIITNKISLGPRLKEHQQVLLGSSETFDES